MGCLGLLSFLYPVNSYKCFKFIPCFNIFSFKFSNTSVVCASFSPDTFVNTLLSQVLA